MAFNPIASRKIEREKMEVVTAFLFLGTKITSDGDCSYEIKDNCYLAGKIPETLGSMLKTEHYSDGKDPYSQGYESFFPQMVL